MPFLPLVMAREKNRVRCSRKGQGAEIRFWGSNSYALYIDAKTRASVLATGSLKAKAGTDAGPKGQVGTWLRLRVLSIVCSKVRPDYLGSPNSLKQKRPDYMLHQRHSP